MSRRTEKDKMYFEIFMHTMNSEMTLEEIGIKYGVSKQRAWQIVRFNHLGKGDYYRGYKMYMDKKSEIDSTPKLDTPERTSRLRDWLDNQNIRLIKGRYEAQNNA
tara:strand:+ start:856 stop:1170 length:315 start_codon:yes stop_codon:yes gene_type:complete